MNIDVGSLRAMAPSLGIPPHRHYDPSDLEDASLRFEWAKFLFRAGYRLRYPQETTGTAVLLFHRFLIQERVGKHRRSRDVILTTCLFLAGKVTEAPRRLRDVINVLLMLTCTTQEEPPLLDKAYWTMKERIVEFEQVLLRTINFQVDAPDPYRLLLNYARSLRLGRTATRSAWGLVNDALFCPRALSAPPQAIACAAIRMATRIHGGERRLRWFSLPCLPGNKKTRKRPRTDGDLVDARGVADAQSTGIGGGEEESREGAHRETVTGDGNSNRNGASSARGAGDNDEWGATSRITAGHYAEPGIESKGEADEVSADGSREHKEKVAGGERVDGGRNRGAVVNGAGAGSEVGPVDYVDNSMRCDDGAVADVVYTSDSGDGGIGTGKGLASVHQDRQDKTTPWWGLFDVRDEDVELVCSELLSLYRRHQDGRNDGTAAGAGTTAGGDTAAASGGFVDFVAGVGGRGESHVSLLSSSSINGPIKNRLPPPPPPAKATVGADGIGRGGRSIRDVERPKAS